MRRYGPDGPIRPSGSPRSALGPPPPATRIAGARRGASIQNALAEARAPSPRVAPGAYGPSPSGESQARDRVSEQALAGGQSGLSELAHDLDRRGHELGAARRANGTAGHVGLGFEALPGHRALPRGRAPGGARACPARPCRAGPRAALGCARAGPGGLGRLAGAGGRRASLGSRRRRASRGPTRTRALGAAAREVDENLPILLGGLRPALACVLVGHGAHPLIEHIIA